MTRRILFILPLVTGASVMLLFGQNLAYKPDPHWKPPASAYRLVNPLRGRTDVLAGGSALFKEHCETCHGDRGQGLRHAADLQLPAVQAQPDGVLFWKISSGNSHTGMPSFSNLPELQRWQLVMFIRALREPRPPQ